MTTTIDLSRGRTNDEHVQTLNLHSQLEPLEDVLDVDLNNDDEHEEADEAGDGEEDDGEEDDGEEDDGEEDDGLDSRDIQAYWRKVVYEMTDIPTKWPTESYKRNENCDFITPVLSGYAQGKGLTRLLVPNQYPYDLMFCLFVLKPTYTLRMCLANVQANYMTTIDHMFNTDLCSEYTCVIFTLATNSVHVRNTGINKEFTFVIYQVAGETSVFHVELWHSELHRGHVSHYMNWCTHMQERTKQIMLSEMRNVIHKLEVVSTKSTRNQCVPDPVADVDTDVKVTVVSQEQIIIGANVHVTNVPPPLGPNVKWAVQKVATMTDATRRLYTHVLGKGSFGVVYGVNKDVVCKRVTNLCNGTVQQKCLDALEEAAITMQMSKCDYIARLFYATLGKNGTVFTCYMFMERATLPLDILFTGTQTYAQQNQWIKPIVEHDTLQALTYMHRHGFVHRDIKFNNMLLFIQGGYVMIKLCDLGCSQMGYSDSSRSGDLYRAAPEVLVYPLYSSASDMFSWAVVMWTMYTGAIPFFTRTQSYYSITQALFKLVGCYRNMALYGLTDTDGLNDETTGAIECLSGQEYLCGHTACELNSIDEFNTVATALYQHYHGNCVPKTLTSYLVANMSIFPQRRHTAADLLKERRYTDITDDLRCRSVTRNTWSDRDYPMPGLLFDRDGVCLRSILVDRSTDDSTRTRYSNKHKTYYGHEHFDITHAIAKTNGFITRRRTSPATITYLTEEDPEPTLNAGRKRSREPSSAASSSLMRKVHKDDDEDEYEYDEDDEDDTGMSAPDETRNSNNVDGAPHMSEVNVPFTENVYTAPSHGVTYLPESSTAPDQPPDSTTQGQPVTYEPASTVITTNKPEVIIINDSPTNSDHDTSAPPSSTEYRSRSPNIVEFPRPPQLLPPGVAGTSTAMPPPDVPQRKKITDRNRRTQMQDSSPSTDTGRSRSAMINHGQIDQLVVPPKYFLRIGYTGTPNIRDVIHKTELVVGQPFLPWFNHYKYIINSFDLKQLSVLPVKDSKGTFMVHAFAQGAKCGVMYITANVGNPLYKYIAEWLTTANTQLFHALFPHVVCQLAIIMEGLQNCTLNPQNPLCLGDLWWNKVKKTVRLDLFNIAITNKLIQTSGNPTWTVWGKPLLTRLATMCNMQAHIANTIRETIQSLQDAGYDVKLTGHTVYIPNMPAEFQPKDPMDDVTGSWCNV